jgi:beta propeller repeat protein
MLQLVRRYKLQELSDFIINITMLTRRLKRKINTLKEDFFEFVYFFRIFLKHLIYNFPKRIKSFPIISIKVTNTAKTDYKKNSHLNSLNILLRTFLLWIIPGFLAVIAFRLTTPALAQLADYDTRLAQYLLSNTPAVAAEPYGQEGFEQIYYIFEDTKHYLTDDSFSHGAPVADHNKVAWMTKIDGKWQIFLYNLTTKSLLQLTHGGQNVNPSISNGKVVWEGWVDGKWQVFLYDGTTIAQLTKGDTSINPEISGDYLIYARKDVSGNWRSAGYSLAAGKELDIAIGNEYKYPHLLGTKIQFGTLKTSRSNFPLTIEDIFTLNLGSLSTTNSKSSLDTILTELNSITITPIPTSKVRGIEISITPTPEVQELSASPSASVTPQAFQ